MHFYSFSLLFWLNVIQLGYEMHMQSFVGLCYTAVELCLNWGKIKIRAAHRPFYGDGRQITAVEISSKVLTIWPGSITAVFVS